MKGYKRPFKMPDMTPIKEIWPVGCRRCQNIWREEVATFKDAPRINGPSYIYDYCDKCITEDEKQKSAGGENG